MFEEPNSSDAPEQPWFLREELLPFAKIAKLIPALRTSNCNSVNPSTVYRWDFYGLKSQMGRCVRLESRRVGGINCSSVQAVARFLQALNDRDDDCGDGATVGAPIRRPPQAPGCRVKANVVDQEQSERATQILLGRGYTK